MGPRALRWFTGSRTLGRDPKVGPCGGSLRRDLHLWRPSITLIIHLQAPFSRQNLTSNPVNYNKSMSQSRVSVEWLLDEIKTYFKFVSLKSQERIGSSAAGKIYCVCALLQNAGTCLYGNQISEFFQFICLISLTFLFIL